MGPWWPCTCPQRTRRQTQIHPSLGRSPCEPSGTQGMEACGAAWRPPPTRCPTSPVMVGCREVAFHCLPFWEGSEAPCCTLLGRECRVQDILAVVWHWLRSSGQPMTPVGYKQLCLFRWHPFWCGGQRLREAGAAYEVMSRLNLNVAVWIFTSRSSQTLALGLAFCVLDTEKSKEEVNKEWFCACTKRFISPLLILKACMDIFGIC